jgi:alkylhydroperoxidase family enzyme
VAKQAGLTEDRVELIDDGYETSTLAPRHKAAIAWVDAFLGNPAQASDTLRARVSQAFAPEELVELTAALALFSGFSKIAIVLGQKPESMPTTVVPTPAFPGPA